MNGKHSYFPLYPQMLFRKQLLYMCRSALMLLLLGLLPAASLHTFYASICEIRPQADCFAIKIKLFTDDLERAIRYEAKGANFSGEEAVRRYVMGRVSVWINHDLQALSWDSLRKDEEATWCYLHFPKNSGVKHVKIQNELLIRSIAQQVNIVRLHLNGEKRFFNLDRQIRFEAIEY